MKHHIFLSYSRTDTAIMQLTRDDFRGAGLKVWTDEGIEPGTQSWKMAIEKALNNAGCVVCMLSPDAAQSRWVRAELDFAETHEIPIFLILARGDERSSVPFGYSTFQWVDIRDHDARSSRIAQLTNTLTNRFDGVELLDADEDVVTPPDLSDLLPPPFEWVEIPAGDVTILDVSDPMFPTTQGGRFHVDKFYIAKYTITNRQYQTYLDADDGYPNPDWWQYSNEAITWRSQHPTPIATAFAGDLLPRTNVNWFDAMAFCRWLTQQTESAFEITLPSETQWQRAAQGNSERTYPWGDTFVESYCNTYEGAIGKPVRVTDFEEGASPFGVMNMSGNVWERSRTTWSTGSDDIVEETLRVIKGGSFSSYRKVAEATARFR
jgi:formylglycine-generating enzyme required for sulfatase activity